MHAPKTLYALLATTATVVHAGNYRGDGTTYTLGQTSAGNCNMMFAESAANDNYAAINDDQWDGSKACGRCAKVWSPSTPDNSEVVYILDRCPECVHGDLDLSPTVFTKVTGSGPSRLDIEWEFTDCPVAGNIKYCLKGGSNAFWTAIQPTNMAAGVKSVQINGAETTMLASAYYFLLDGQSQTQTDLSSVTISLTSISGETIEDTVSLEAGSCTEGSHQFSNGGASSPSDNAPSPPSDSSPPPSPPSYPSPSPSSSSPPPPPATTSSGPTMQPSSPPPKSPNPTTTPPVPDTSSSSSSSNAYGANLTPPPTVSTKAPAKESQSSDDVAGKVNVAHESSIAGESTLGEDTKPSTSTPSLSDADKTQLADATKSKREDESNLVNTESKGTSSGGTGIMIAVFASVGALAIAAAVVIAVKARRRALDAKAGDDPRPLQTFGDYSTPAVTNHQDASIL